MGKITRQSDRFKLDRLLNEPDVHQRDTLPICPVCGGIGKLPKKEVVVDNSTYRTVDVERTCTWCSGDGEVSPKVQKMYGRWIKILELNRARGACGSPSEPDRP